MMNGEWCGALRAFKKCGRRPRRSASHIPDYMGELRHKLGIIFLSLFACPLLFHKFLADIIAFSSVL
ncbi:MAG: hypothetical protein MUF15_05240 [Acidobacteria bacterium]|jgi:hypothetical protein|nr:hypothetical protein [Acidobacteriota bacterium]